MKIQPLTLLIGILLITIIFTSCSLPASNQVSAKLQPRYILSQINYNPDLCSNIGFNYKPEGFNTGVRTVLKDRYTNEKIKGYGTIMHEGGSSGMGIGEESSYSCEEQINSQKAVIYVAAEGYTSLALEIELPKDKMSTIEVPMVKSCSGGPSCFDNLKIISSFNQDEVDAKKSIESAEEWFFEIIKADFGFEKSDYSLSCVECELARGGYIKARGIYRDGTPFELYDHWGWCSSGGTDCGGKICFSSQEPVFSSVKELVCSRIISYDFEDDHSIPGIVSSVKVNDTTQEVIEQCMNGGFENNNNNQKSMGVNMASYRYHNSASPWNTDCIAG